MTIARRPSPFGELLSLRTAMDRLFEDSFVRPTGWYSPGTLDAQFPVDVRVTDDELVIEGQLPGVKSDDVDITIREIRRGSFSRSVTLPTGLEPDKATAAFDDGVLTLRIPKAEQVKPRQIRISPASNGSQTKPAVTATAGDRNDAQG